MWLKMSEFKQLTGPAIDLGQMLTAREQRAVNQTSLLQNYPDATLLCGTMRIPGPIKTGPKLKWLVQQFCETIQKQYETEIVDQLINIEAITGPEFYFVLNVAPKQLKQEMICFEQEDLLGAIWDLDVLYWDFEQLVQVSRVALGAPRRTCLVCGQDAKNCSRSRQHGLLEVQLTIEQIIAEGWDARW